MQKILKHRRLLLRIAFIISCFLAAMIYQTSKAAASEKQTTVTEIKIKESGAEEITVQVRTSDGKPVVFKMTALNGSVTYTLNLIHSKITPLKNVKKGDYQYTCSVKGQTIMSGKYSMR
jgi:hypothetical protein